MAAQKNRPNRNLKEQIAREIYIALNDLAAPSHLLSITARWIDGEDDHRILETLRTVTETDTRSPAADAKAAIAREIYIALDDLDAPPSLLFEIGRWSEGEDDVFVSEGLRVFNEAKMISTDVSGLQGKSKGLHPRSRAS